IGIRRARSEHDADWLLYSFKNPRVDPGLVPLWRAVDYPNLVGGATEIIAHLLEAGSIEEASHRDKAHNPCIGVWVVIKDFPRRPPPEVHVQIAQVLGVCTDTPVTRRYPSGEWRQLGGIRTPSLDPATTILCLLLVRRVADHHSDWLLLLDLIRLPTRLCNRSEDCRKPLLL